MDFGGASKNWEEQFVADKLKQYGFNFVAIGGVEF